MPFKIVRNDITKMNTEAIVNTANSHPVVGPGCDSAIYDAAGYDELLKYRRENIGEVQEGEVFITPGFGLKARYIIHAVSPLYRDGNHDEETKLRSCYQKSLALAKEKGISSIAFPLISTGGFGYPLEEGMRIAVDEMNAFLLTNDMLIYLVVFDSEATKLGERIYPDLEAYIDQNYVKEAEEEEYSYSTSRFMDAEPEPLMPRMSVANESHIGTASISRFRRRSEERESLPYQEEEICMAPEFIDFEEEHESRLEERIKHISDTFSEYLLYLIRSKGMENAEVYKRAIVDKKTFSKIKNNPDYHPQKITALCLCVGARLNLDETKDLLARAGYALAPCDMTDIIFSYFIENEIYDMIELDIQLEEHGLPCIIS